MLWKSVLITCSFLPMVLLAVRIGVAEADDASPARFDAAVVRGENGQQLPYRFLKPSGYDSQKKYPLVLFFHGAGERGTENNAQLTHVVSIFATPENRRQYPCFAVAPQCPTDQQWVDVPWNGERSLLPEKPSWPMALSVKMIEELEKKYSIDAKRIYVMGLSMGGYGAWDAVARYPETFAAAVPICGGGDETRAATIAKIPIWAFHGGQDGVVRTSRSRNMVAALRKAGGSPKYTEYPDAGHDSWTQASHEKDLLPWLFGQARR